MKIRKTEDPEKGYESKNGLYIDTQKHRIDVFHVMSFLALELIEAGYDHDWSKIKYFDQFAQDTLERKDTPDFKSRPWYNIHTKEERHHITANLRDDIDFIDILEFIADCVVAGKARSGRVNKKYLELSGETLKKAYWNTVNKLIDEIEVEKD